MTGVSAGDKAVGRFPTTVDLGPISVNLDEVRAASLYAARVVPPDGLRDVLEALGVLPYEGGDRERSGGRNRRDVRRVQRPGISGAL